MEAPYGLSTGTNLGDLEQRNSLILPFFTECDNWATCRVHLKVNALSFISFHSTLIFKKLTILKGSPIPHPTLKPLALGLWIKCALHDC